MRYKLVPTQDKASDGTGDNELPNGWREVTIEELAKDMTFVTYIPDYYEYRYITLDGRREDAMMFWYYNQTGYAMVHIYNYKKGNRYRFFVFGCQHVFRELSQRECRDRGLQHFGRCWHVYECKKCKFIESQDSSD